MPITYHDVARPHSFGTSWSLASDVRRRIAEFDVVHVHQVFYFHGLVATNLARHRVPVVISPHGVFDPFHRNVHPLKKAIYTSLFERHNTSRANAFHYASMAERDHAAEAGLPDRAFVIPPAVETSSGCEIGPLLRLHPELTGKILVTFLGRLTPAKRLDLVVDAFAKVAATNPEIHLVIAGPDSEGIGTAVCAQIDLLGIRERVSLVGIVTGAARDALLANSQMMLLPSDSESFGLAAVEAMAVGVPVIVSEGVAIHREVASAQAGLVVERDPEHVAEAIRSLICTETHGLMSANARSLVASAFGAKQMADRLEEMYQVVIKRGPL